MLSLGATAVLRPVKDVKTLRIPVSDGFTNVTHKRAGAVLKLDYNENVQAIQQFLNEKTKRLTHMGLTPSNNDKRFNYSLCCIGRGLALFF